MLQVHLETCITYKKQFQDWMLHALSTMTGINNGSPIHYLSSRKVAQLIHAPLCATDDPLHFVSTFVACDSMHKWCLQQSKEIPGQKQNSHPQWIRSLVTNTVVLHQSKQREFSLVLLSTSMHTWNGETQRLLFTDNEPLQTLLQLLRSNLYGKTFNIAFVWINRDWPYITFTLKFLVFFLLVISLFFSSRDNSF